MHFLTIARGQLNLMIVNWSTLDSNPVPSPTPTSYARAEHLQRDATLDEEAGSLLGGFTQMVTASALSTVATGEGIAGLI